MTERELDLWWSSLQTTEKSRIASKAAQKVSGPDAAVAYPECTRWWLTQEPDEKQRIYQHCTDHHGLLLPEYRSGQTFSY